jgi:prephenate dehydratase
LTSNELTVAYPGREGAHSAAACDRLFPAARLVPLSSFREVADAVATGRCTYAVLPIESSLAGPVNETHDLLFDSPLSIVAEAVLAVHHCLVGIAEIALEDVREIRSHPVALDQCRDLLAAMPWATATVAPTTGDAAHAVAGLGDPSVVAVASERAARMHRLVVLKDNVGDHPEAYTRFAAIAPYTRLDRRHGAWRTAFSFVTDHRPGALHRAIEPLARRGIDMVQLVSRPIPRSPFRYRFDCVLGGHPLDEDVSAALAEMLGETARLTVFGSYRADREDEPVVPAGAVADRVA